MVNAGLRNVRLIKLPFLSPALTIQLVKLPFLNLALTIRLIKLPFLKGSVFKIWYSGVR
jgi:hypothetical protein